MLFQNAFRYVLPSARMCCTVLWTGTFCFVLPSWLFFAAKKAPDSGSRFSARFGVLPEKCH